LAQNRQLAEDVRQSEADINAKYDAEVLKQTTELNQQRALMLFDQIKADAVTRFPICCIVCIAACAFCAFCCSFRAFSWFFFATSNSF
jgi:hypothetical protein